jgi:hypothetical protein
MNGTIHGTTRAANRRDPDSGNTLHVGRHPIGSIVVQGAGHRNVRLRS